MSHQPGGIFIRITSTGGRIGPFWWFNSDMTPQERYFGTGRGVYTVRYGTFGIGHHVRMHFEVVRPLGYEVSEHTQRCAMSLEP